VLADRRYRYPPTISDFARRYLFSCDSLVTVKEPFASAVLRSRELGKRRAWSVMAGPAPPSDEAMPLEHGVHGADGGEVDVSQRRRSFSRIFRRPSSG
jgi:hypothetical protein